MNILRTVIIQNLSHVNSKDDKFSRKETSRKFLKETGRSRSKGMLILKNKIGSTPPSLSTPKERYEHSIMRPGNKC